MESDRLELLAKISGYYFEESLTQAQIAARTGYSPSMISRLLADARKEGIVEIRVHHPIPRRVDLEQELHRRLGLRAVRVVACGTLEYSQMLHRLGTVAAQVIEDHVHDRMAIGVSWGTGVYETVTALRLRSDIGVGVVQLIGSLDTTRPEISGPELTQALARALNGQYTILPAPLVVDSEETRQSLLNDSRVRQVISKFRNIELALVGVGTIAPPEYSALQRAGYLTSIQAAELAAAGAVGDVCSIFFDCDGRLINHSLTRRVIGIDAANLEAIPLKIGVAGGPFKKLPIIGAGRAGLINVLVTDDVTATSIVQEIQGDRNRNGNEY